MTANYHSIDTFSSVDGPGIRYVLFLQGCNMQCKYCHNIDATLKLNAKTITTDEVVRDFLQYKQFYQNGGITVSGGEPLLQIGFLIELFTKMKANGVHTCLETQGTLFKDNKAFRDLSSLTDLFIVNLKATDNEEAKKVCNTKIGRTLALLDFLHKMQKKFILTYVLIPDVNDAPETLQKLGMIKKQLQATVFILPFHQLGKEKWEELGFNYPFGSVREATEDDVRRARFIIDKETGEEA